MSCTAVTLEPFLFSVFVSFSVGCFSFLFVFIFLVFHLFCLVFGFLGTNVLTFKFGVCYESCLPFIFPISLV